MWRKGILLQFLALSILLAGTAEAREAGSSGKLVAGRAVAEPAGVPSVRQDGWAKPSGMGALARFRSGLEGEGEVGSHIDPDGSRMRSTVDPNG